MANFDIYGNVQITKNPKGKKYEIGDEVHIPDGVYVGHEGVIVISDKKLTNVFKNVKDKKGKPIQIQLENKFFSNATEEMFYQDILKETFKT